MGEGILYGVGVGPGDPKLMTIRAGEVIRDADVLAYPVNGKGESRARTIAAPVIAGRVEELPVHLPMQVKREPARAAYDAGATAIRAHIDDGKSVAWLCVGDPMLYGSFMYLAARLGDCRIEVIPGVASITACAARTRTPLAGRNDVLSVVPATLGEAELSAALERADAAVIVKVGKHFDKVRSVLETLGLTGHATILEGASMDGETITALADLRAGEQSYFSTILVRRGELT